MTLVSRVVAAEQRDETPSWSIDLRAAIGPLARTKRLRMVRETMTVPSTVRFVRKETDGRQHSPWELTVTLQPTEPQNQKTLLTVHLYYGGSLFAPVLGRLLDDALGRSEPRLNTYLNDHA